MTSELAWSLKNGDLDQVKNHLATEKLDVNSSIDGRPLLLFAADYGHDEIVSFLLDRGADVNSKDKHGISALLAAIWEGHTKCVKLLIDRGADRTGRTPDGKLYAEVAEKPEIINLLK